MELVVVDTDIIIDFLRTGSGLLPALFELQTQGKIELYLTSMTIFELLAGDMPTSQESLIEKLVSYFQIIPLTREIAAFAGVKKRGKKLSITVADYIIGISTVYYRAQLATRNKKHFSGIPNLVFYEMRV